MILLIYKYRNSQFLILSKLSLTKEIENILYSILIQKRILMKHKLNLFQKSLQQEIEFYF